MEALAQIGAASFTIFREAAPYILFGFVLAGFLHVYINPSLIVRYFQQGRFRSVLYASLLGIPIPL